MEQLIPAIEMNEVRTITPAQYLQVFAELQQDPRIIRNRLNAHINLIGSVSFRILLILGSSFLYNYYTAKGFPVEEEVLATILDGRSEDEFNFNDFTKMMEITKNATIAEIKLKKQTRLMDIMDFIEGVSKLEGDGQIESAVKNSAIRVMNCFKAGNFWYIHLKPVWNAAQCMLLQPECENPVPSLTILIAAYAAYGDIAKFIAYGLIAGVTSGVLNVAIQSVIIVAKVPFIILGAAGTAAYNKYLATPTSTHSNRSYSSGLLQITAANGVPPMCITMDELGANIHGMMNEPDVNLSWTGLTLGQGVYYGVPRLISGLYSNVVRAPENISYLITSGRGIPTYALRILASVYVDEVVFSGIPIVTAITAISNATRVIMDKTGYEGDRSSGSSMSGGIGSNMSNSSSSITVVSSGVSIENGNHILRITYDVCGSGSSSSAGSRSMSSLSSGSAVGLCETKTRQLEINEKKFKSIILSLLNKIKNKGQRSKKEGKGAAKKKKRTAKRLRKTRKY